MAETEDRGNTARLTNALRYLNNSFRDYHDGRIEQLERDLIESTRLITDVFETTDVHSLSVSELELLRDYVALGCKLAELLKQKRTALKDALMGLNNTEKINDCYNAGR